MRTPSLPTTIALVSLLCLGAAVAGAQEAFEPFGVDIEHIDRCGLDGCPVLDEAAEAGAQWVRLFVLWRWIELNPPTGEPKPDVPGQRSGAHEYNFGWLDQQIEYARAKGMQVYLTMNWAPSWANGADTDSVPLTGQGDQCGSAGYAVLNPDHVSDLFYNLASHFKGRVKYYGVWNEPNNACNYNAANLGIVPGDYLNEWVSRYLAPAADAVRLADPGALVVAPELQYGDASCGNVRKGRCNWYDSWLKPLVTHFGSYFDVISLHLYERDHKSVREIMDELRRDLLALPGRDKPVWLTEANFNPHKDWRSDGREALNLERSFVDLHNRRDWWTKTFYSMGNFDTSVLGRPACRLGGLVCSEDGETLVRKPAFHAFASAYGPRSREPIVASVPAEPAGADSPDPMGDAPPDRARLVSAEGQGN